MGLEGPNSTDKVNESKDVLDANIIVIDETLKKLGYKLDYVDGGSGRKYVAIDDPQNILNVFGGISRVPKDRKIKQGDVVSALYYANDGLRGDNVTKQINELLGTDIPKKLNRYENKDLKSLSLYIINYRYLPNNEKQKLKHIIIGQIEEQTGIELDDTFTFDGNVLTMKRGPILIIDGKWINRNDKQFGKIRMINISFLENKIDVIKK